MAVRRTRSTDDAGGRGDGACDAGAAVVEFVMVSVLLIFLLFAVLQVAVFFYARNIVSASAADAARYAAAAGVDPGSGAARARQLIAQGLGSSDAAAIRCSSGTATDAASRLPVTTVHCTGHVRAIFAPVDLPLSVDVSSSALQERTP
jgi:Flp pilus assembly protein TadG